MKALLPVGLALVPWPFIFCGSSNAALIKRVTGYWEETINQNRARVLTFVHPLSHSRFIGLPELWFRNWKLQSVQSDSDVHSLVRIEADVILPPFQKAFKAQVVQHWRLADGEWYLTVPFLDPAELNRLFYASDTPVQPSEGLSIVPRVLILHFLNRVQRGSFNISNDGQTAVEVKRVEPTNQDIRIVGFPPTIQPGARGRITVEVTGDSEAKELTALLRITTFSEGSESTIQRSVLYNHIGPETRAFFGLTEEEARLLPRGVRPEPVLKPIFPPKP